MNRRGLTLTELLMAMVVMGILGTALVRILVNDSRFVSRQDAMLSARQGARAALNTVLAELAMVADTVIFATRDSFQVRVPIAFGITCRAPTGSTRIVSFLPVDSVAWSTLDTSGMLWRQRTGGFRRVSPSSIAITSSATDSAQCKQDSVHFVPGGKLIKLSGLNGPSQFDSLQVAMLFSRVTYKFAASADLPGRWALWRKAANAAAAEELVTPFDTSAKFVYLMGGPRTVNPVARIGTVAGSAALDSIRGVELRLYAASANKPQGMSSYPTFPLKTRVRFINRSVP